MTNLRSALSKRIEEAWNTARPDPEPSDVLTESWYGISNAARLNLVDFADRLIGQLIEDGKLAEPSRPLHLWHAEVTKMLNEIGGLGDLSQGDAVKRIRQLQLLEEYEVTEDQLRALIDVIAVGKFVPSIHLMQFIDAGISVPSEWMELNRVTTDGHEAHALVKQATELAKMGVTSEDFQAFMRQHLAAPQQDDVVTIDPIHCECCQDNEPAPLINSRNVRADDRVRIYMGYDTVHEVTVNRVNETGIAWYGGLVKHEGIEKVHLLDRPVVHPDPAEHRLIMIPRFNGVDKDPHLKPFFWNGQHYESLSAPEYFSAREITEWKPARIVAAGDYRG